MIFVLNMFDLIDFSSVKKLSNLDLRLSPPTNYA